MIPVYVRIRFTNALGEEEEREIPVVAVNVWAAVSQARMMFVKSHPRATVREVSAVGPKI